MPPHYYPPDIARALQERWPAPAQPLLPAPLLTHLISVAYQASLLRDEGRLVQGQLLCIAPAEAVPADAGEPFVLPFATPHPCTEQEIRRLSPTVQRGSTALAVAPGPTGELQLWGLVLIGTEWENSFTLQDEAAGHQQTLLLHIRQPGSLSFFCGNTRVLTLQQGHIEGHGFLQFPMAWAAGHFGDLPTLPFQPPASPSAEWQAAAAEIAGTLALHVLRRILTTVRDAGHGGMVVLVSASGFEALSSETGVLWPKYRVAAHRSNEWFGQLMTEILTRLNGASGSLLSQFQQAPYTVLRTLERQVEELTHLLADLMAVDGALVLDKNFNILSFGTEIRVSSTSISHVYRALDMDAQQLRPERLDSGGTRHRAAYRLCQADARCLAIVVSQDGAVKFVRHREGKVIFWDQLAL
ncbi:hypothetical protein HNQ93_004239 [Hymenobacter luteus]|uniref:Probable sensor domain-containing protein n=2 Tax=Hymenobacter TaxID=89966 RepID=A0A7W9T4G5_9BACT|nr:MULTISPECIES: diadenylate cyclase [Hymenobacter]MBB4603612.1 hypothetical protein [Hymenobacter latericoloratus]MBB6061360.1 hypothetical protein [Hymenobacter luteus]